MDHYSNLDPKSINSSSPLGKIANCPTIFFFFFFLFIVHIFIEQFRFVKAFVLFYQLAQAQVPRRCRNWWGDFLIAKNRKSFFFFSEMRKTASLVCTANKVFVIVDFFFFFFYAISIGNIRNSIYRVGAVYTHVSDVYAILLTLLCVCVFLHYVRRKQLATWARPRFPIIARADR